MDAKTFTIENYELIHNKDFETFYKKLRSSAFFDMVGEVTDLLIKSGINPLEYLTYIPDFCFYGLDIKAIKIPNSIKYIGEGAFIRCELLMSVAIPDSVTEIGDDAFWDCNSLDSIAIPDSVKEIGENAFAYCRHLTIKCRKYSYVDKYAKEHRIKVEYI